MKILYLFPTPRENLIKNSINHKAPDTLLYGYNHLKKLGYHVDFLDLPLGKTKLWYLVLFLIEELFFLTKKINFQIYRVLPKVKEINSYDVVVTCSDSIGLPVALLKKIGILKPKQIYMSIDFVNKFSDKSLIKNFFKWILSSTEAIVCFSKKEQTSFKSIFKIPNTKVYFIPIGGDPLFFRPNKKIKKSIILFVGKDRSRDLKLFMKIAERTKEKIVIVTTSKTKIPTNKHLPNVEIIKDTSFTSLKKLYQKAKVLVIPLLEINKASGQLVLMDGVFTKTPILVSKVEGIMSAYEFGNKEVTYVEPNNAEMLKSKLNFMLNHSDLVNKAAEKAYDRAMSKYTTEIFSLKLFKILKLISYEV